MSLVLASRLVHGGGVRHHSYGRTWDFLPRFGLGLQSKGVEALSDGEIVVEVPVVYKHQVSHIPPQLANFRIKSVNIGSCFTINQQKPQLAWIGQKHYCAGFALD